MTEIPDSRRTSLRRNIWIVSAAIVCAIGGLLAVQGLTPERSPSSAQSKETGAVNALFDEQVDALGKLHSASVADDSQIYASNAASATWTSLVADRSVLFVPPLSAVREGSSCIDPAILQHSFIINPRSLYPVPSSLLQKAGADVGLTYSSDGALRSVDGLWIQMSTTGRPPLSELDATFTLRACWDSSSGPRLLERVVSLSANTAAGSFRDRVEMTTKSADLSVNFESVPTGDYSQAEAKQEWETPDSRALGYLVRPEGSLTVQGNSVNQFLTKKFTAGLYNTSGDPSIDDRVLIKWDLLKPVDELYFGYRVRASDSFDPAKGGKLPGLCGGTCPTGGVPLTNEPQTADGGNNPDGTAVGWSGRGMWRKNGYLVQYMYYPNQVSHYAVDFPYKLNDQNVYITDGAWHSIENYVRMNTPGSDDGEFKTWYDGQLVLDVKGLRFHDDESYAIDGLKFTSYFGGNDPSWAPTSDSSLSYDDVTVSDSPITH